MSRLTDAAEALACAAAAIRFNVVVADYELGADLPVAKRHQHRHELKADGWTSVAEALDAAITLCPKHNAADRWRADRDAARDHAAFHRQVITSYKAA